MPARLEGQAISPNQRPARQQGGVTFDLEEHPNTHPTMADGWIMIDHPDGGSRRFEQELVTDDVLYGADELLGPSGRHNHVEGIRDGGKIIGPLVLQVLEDTLDDGILDSSQLYRKRLRGGCLKVRLLLEAGQIGTVGYAMEPDELWRLT